MKSKNIFTCLFRNSACKFICFNYVFLVFILIVNNLNAQDPLLINAIKIEDYTLAKQLIEKGANIQSLDEHGANAILWATKKGNIELVKILAKKGANLYPSGVIYNETKRSNWGNLTSAAVFSNNIELLKYLIEDLAIPVDDKEFNPRTKKRNGWTALRWALNFQNNYEDFDRKEMIEYLLHIGADHNLARLDLGIYSRDGGRFFDAISYIEQEVEYLKKPENKGNLMYVLYELAATHRIMGAYNKAIPLYLDIVSKYEQANKTRGQIYVYTLNRLGGTYQLMGDYDKSKFYFQKSSALFKEILGKEHRDYAVNTHSLAVLHEKQEEFKIALRLLEEILPIYKNLLEKEQLDSIHYFRCILDIAKNPEYQKRENDSFEKINLAIKYFQSNEVNFDYAMGINELANWYIQQKKYQLGKKYLEKGIQIIKNLHSPSHYYNREWNLQLAEIEEQLKTIDKSQESFIYVSNLTNDYIKSIFNKFSEDSQQAMSLKEEKYYNKLQSFNYRHQNLKTLNFNNELFLRGFLLNNKKSLLAKLKHNKESDLSLDFEKWVSLRKIITKQETLPLDQTIPNLKEIKVEADELESKLARKSNAFKEQQNIPTWEDIQAKLEPNEAAIQITHFNYYEPLRKTDSILYLAQIIRHEYAEPKSVYLFEEKEVKTILGYNVDSNKPTNYTTIDYLYGSRGIIPKTKNKQKGLEFIWNKLMPYLENCNTVHISNSGILNEVNLGAIPINESELVLDHFQIHQYINLSRLLSVDEKNNKSNNNYLLVGGVDYKNPKLPSKNINTAWQYLEGASIEVQKINKIIQKAKAKPLLLQNTLASEAFIKGLLNKKGSPKCIHFATHGFFFPKPTNDTLLQIHSKNSIYANSEDPMVRSGLILANANDAWTGNLTDENKEDGILTAKEVTDLYLDNTELVVLSACQTGLGDIISGEGIYGLQRAFKIAGASKLLLSLWPVDDITTNDLMTAFYKNWLQKKQPLEVAFKYAQLEMREKYKSPYLWAGFILVK